MQIFAIDLGTTKIVSVLGEKTGEGPNAKYKVLAYSETKSQGIYDGEVQNLRSAADKIRESMSKIREMRQITDIDKVFVGIAGQQVDYRKRSFSVSRPKRDEEISEKEIEDLENAANSREVETIRDEARSQHSQNDKEVLHVIPQKYSIDGRDNIEDPVGRLGSKLTGHFFVIIGNTNSKICVELCIKRVNLSLNKLVFEPLASAQATLSHDEKDLGVALVDIGGGTTDIIVYCNGVVEHTSIVPFGGNFITEQIRKKSRILLEDAERIKIMYGSCMPSEISEADVIEVKGIGSSDKKEISRRVLAMIIEKCVKHILDKVLTEIMPYSKRLFAGIVYTGGVSQMNGFIKFAHQHAESVMKHGIKDKEGKTVAPPQPQTELVVKLGRPEYIDANNVPGDFIKPAYATISGLLMYGCEYNPVTTVDTGTETEIAANTVAVTDKTVATTPTPPVPQKPWWHFFAVVWKAVVDFFSGEDDEKEDEKEEDN
jgi:cell division protein FtsA